jgi:amino acid transporter
MAPQDKEERQKAEAPALVRPAARPERFSKRLRRVLLGNPIHTDRAAHTLLPKYLALPIFASDALSSCAYATQEIVLVLGAAGLGSTATVSLYQRFSFTTAVSIIVLLAIVVMSYRQTIFAYPNGGGSYRVTSDHLATRGGIRWGLIAGGALLIDYILTVSVSVAAGIQNLASIPYLEQNFHVGEHKVLYCLVAITVLMLANLRGLKESGTLFATVTYSFVGMCFVMIFLGVFGPSFGWQMKMENINEYRESYAKHFKPALELSGLALLMLVLQAFASGCTAMTGVEAVSDGVPAFQQPKSKNAATTLLVMAIILGSIFLGISYLVANLKIVYFADVGIKGQAGYVAGTSAVIDQISGAVFGKTGPLSFLYLYAQFATAGILILAANTAFADFPRLSFMMAQDKFMPKQFANLGDKLVFNNGIVILGLCAALLIALFKGSVDSLIPLYAVGVFLAFTLSQSSMVLHWQKYKSSGWQTKAVINGIGATATFVVLVTIIFEKFTHGAWAVIAMMAVLYAIFLKINRHYHDVAHQLSLHHYSPPETPLHNTVLVLVPTLHRGVMPAIRYARTLSTDCRAVHIELDSEKTPRLIERWEQWFSDTPLVVLHSPYRSLVGPIMRYLDAVQVERKDHLVTVVVPEFVPARWWHSLLHGNTGWILRLALLGRLDVVLVNFRYELTESKEAHIEPLDESEERSQSHHEPPSH